MKEGVTRLHFKGKTVLRYRRDGHRFSPGKQEEVLQAYARALGVVDIPSLEKHSFNEAVTLLATEAEPDFTRPSSYLTQYVKIEPLAYFHDGVRIGPLKTALVASLHSEGGGVGLPTPCLFAGVYQNLSFLYVPEQSWGLSPENMNLDLFQDIARHPQRKRRDQYLDLAFCARSDYENQGRKLLDTIREGFALSELAGDERFGEALEALELELVDDVDVWLMPPSLKSLAAGNPEILFKRLGSGE